MNDDSRPKLPEPPAGRDPNAEPEPQAPPPPHKANYLPLVALVVALVAILFVGGRFLSVPAVVSSPSPSVDPPSRIVAPSDEVVLKELQAQLALFQSQGAEAANARLSSYRQGVMTAGCRVGLGHGVNFSSLDKALEAGLRYVEAARRAFERQGASYGGAAVAIEAKEGFDYYVIFVTCPPIEDQA